MEHARRCIPYLVFAAVSLTASASAQYQTSLASVNSRGDPADAYSTQGHLSGDGSLVAFQSQAKNLVPGVTGGLTAVYLRDPFLGTTTLVSSNLAGGLPDKTSARPKISADGSVIVYESSASDIVPGDTNATADVFVFEVATGLTTRVSLDSSGAQSTGGCGYAAVSGDGRWVTFLGEGDDLVPGDTNGVDDIFLHDRSSGATTRVSVSSVGAQASADSSRSSISEDGRWISFDCAAPELVPGDTNGNVDVFLHDRVTGATTRVSVDAAGAEVSWGGFASSVSGDGSFVSFESSADDLVPGDVNGNRDIFRKERVSGAITISSLSSSGALGNGHSVDGWISSDGSRVAFKSWSTNFAAGTAGNSDVFVHDHVSGETMLVSMDSFGIPGNSESRNVALSPEGDHAVFESSSNNLIPGGTDNKMRVYVRDLRDCAAWTYCEGGVNSTGQPARIFWSGSTEIASNDFMLTVVGGPPAQPGLFVFGSMQTQSVLGEGFLCVTGHFARLLPARTFDPSGAVSYALDFADPLSPASAIQAGDEYSFQFVYRDPAGGGSGFNLSDGLFAHFCP